MLTVKGVSAYPPLVIFSFLFGFSKGGCCITEVYVVVVVVGVGGRTVELIRNRW